MKDSPEGSEESKKKTPRTYKLKTHKKTRRDYIVSYPAAWRDWERLQQSWKDLGAEARFEMPTATWKYRRDGGKWTTWQEEDHFAYIREVGVRIQIDPQNGDMNPRVPWIIREGDYNAARKQLARSHQCWPLVDWVKDCQIDPVNPLQLDNWLGIGFDAEDSAYNRFVQEYFWTSLVRRILSPGFKVKCAVVLVGPSGVGKGPMLESILPPDLKNFVTTIIDWSGTPPQLYPYFEGMGIIILGEMSNIKMADESKLKQILDAPDGSYLPKGLREMRFFDMSGIFVGTANLDENFLPVGKIASQRFLPIKFSFPTFVKEFPVLPTETWMRENCRHLIALACKKIKEGSALNVSFVPPEIRGANGEEFRACLDPEVLERANDFADEYKDCEEIMKTEVLKKALNAENVKPGVFKSVMKNCAKFEYVKNPTRGYKIVKS